MMNNLDEQNEKIMEYSATPSPFAFWSFQKHLVDGSQNDDTIHSNNYQQSNLNRQFCDSSDLDNVLRNEQTNLPSASWEFFWQFKKPILFRNFILMLFADVYIMIRKSLDCKILVLSWCCKLSLSSRSKPKKRL